jgi:hypothetical protein
VIDVGSVRSEIVYFDIEGRQNYEEVLQIVATFSRSDDQVEAAVVFAGTNEGALQAADALADLAHLVVVTYRAEAREYFLTEDGSTDSKPVGLDDATADVLAERGVRVVRSAMPLSSEVVVLRYADPKLSGIREAYRTLSGGLVLVTQAILMACDAGCIKEGQRVIAFAADTAVIASAAHSDTMFFPEVGLEIEQLLCKPSRLNVSRPRTAEQA